MRWRISQLVTKGARLRLETKAMVVVCYGKVAIRLLPSVPGVTEDLISAVAVQVQMERQGITLLLVHCLFLLIANTIASLFYGFWDDCIQPLSDYCTSLWRSQRASSSGYTKVYNHTPSPQSDIDHIPSLHFSITTFSSSTSFPPQLLTIMQVDENETKKSV